MASKLRRTPLFGYDGNLGIPIIPPTATTATSTTGPAGPSTATSNNNNQTHVPRTNEQTGYKHINPAGATVTKIKMEVATAAATSQQQQQQHYVNPAASVTASTTVADTRVDGQSNGVSTTTISSKTMHHHHQQAGTSSALPATTSTKISSATPSNATTNSGHAASSTNRHSTTSSNSTTSCQRLSRHSSSNSPGTPNRHVNFGGGDSAEEKKREKFLTAKYGAHQMALIRKRLRVEMWMYERLQELYGADDIEIDLDEVLDMDDESDRRTYISELLRIDGNHPCTKSERVNGFVGDLLEKVKTL